MDRLAGKTALVTGAGKGIGEAICHRLADEGAHVAVTDLHDGAAERVAKAIAKQGGIASHWRMDVTDESMVKRVMESAAAAMGGINVLVNNAGIIGANKPTHELTETEWDRVMAVNVKGSFFCTKHVVPHMLRASTGSIIYVGSVYGIVGAPNSPAYHASKGAVRLMAKTDALLYAKAQIRVNSIAPAFTKTMMLADLLDSLGGERNVDELKALIPLGQLSEPDDVAWGVVYLASDEAKFITGTDLVIDGGYTAR